MLENYNNYGVYADFIKTGHCNINVSHINRDTWGDHFNSILNILRDGIETDFVQSKFINVHFDNDNVMEISIADYYFNLIMWNLIIKIGDVIEPKHIFFDEAITRNTIKDYIDKFFIDDNRKTFSNLELNNIIDDTLYQYSKVDEFSWYLANTINLEDTINLMDASEEFNSIMHADLSNVPIEDVRKVGMDMTNTAIKYMKNAKPLIGYEHCLADSWRAQEGINPKQYKEFAVNIGSKPNGMGGVFPAIINKSFIMGGVNDTLSYFIESSTGRTAQVLAKENIGNSGSFARLLGLNNTDSILHANPNYDCDTRNYQELFIRDIKTLRMVRNRYYRTHIHGMEYLLKGMDSQLIGTTIYLRSPMTCVSNSRGEGICYKCYGDLAYTNCDINIGKIAAEEVSSKLTQILLSAKHLLETIIEKLEWLDRFFDIFEIDGNIIKLLSDTDFKGWYMIIEKDSIKLANEDDYSKNEYEDAEEGSTMSAYNEYVEKVHILTNTGELIEIASKNSNPLYISTELNEHIRKHAKPVDNNIHIPLRLKGKDDEAILDIPLFFIAIHNNELSKTMDKLMDIIDKNSVTTVINRHALLQLFIDTIIEGNLDVDAIHCELILSNQIRHVDSMLEKPEWQYADEPYTMLTLNQALTNNPSVVVSLLYQRLSKMLYNPLTFKKNAPSFMDLFFMEQPQQYLSSQDIKPAVKDTNVEINLVSPVIKCIKIDAGDDYCKEED